MSLAAICMTLALHVGGCASTSTKSDTMTTAESAAEPGVNPRSLTPLHGETGSPITWSELVSTLAGADVVVIGENHGHALGLAAAAAIFDDILAANPAAVLSLEFIERDEQPTLDDYLAGIIDEKTFREATKRTEGNYPDGHRRMVEAAKAANRPVIAANAPRRYVRLARLEGYERLQKLSPEQRRLFRIPDALPEGRYRADFEKVMRDMASQGHGAASVTPGQATPPSVTPDPAAEAALAARIAATFRSQVLWDWTMADSIVRGLDSGRPVVHVVGRFHSDFRGGTIEAIERLRTAGRVITISMIDDTSNSLREEDKSRADFIIYTGPAAK
jgi:uncharacterized iron-regulated protein